MSFLVSHMRVINVIDYNPQLINIFNAEKILLQKVMASCCPEIHHVGSTSVPNLAAKPVIDILVEVDSLGELDRLDAEMIELSYWPKGEFGISGRRYYQKGGNNRSHQVHAFEKGSPEIIRHLAYRDYLIQYPAIAAEYEALKRKGAQLSNNRMAEYCEYKNDFIQHHERLAVEWWALQKSSS